METTVETARTGSLTRRGFLTGAVAVGAASALGFAGCAPGATSAASAESSPADVRTYTGSGAGRMGDIMVKVGIADNVIASVEVIKQHETPMIANSALSRIPQLVVRNQSLDIDAVTGATITSFGLKEAIGNALSQAGLSEKDLAKTGKDDGIKAEEPIEADIAVVGGGLTGLVAAARALQNGKRVALFEETAHLGGSSCVSDGWITGADTIMERAEGIEDSADQFYAFLTQGSEDPAIVPYPEITRTYAETSGPLMDWLDTYVNVDFGERKGGYGLYTPPDQPRIYGVNNGGGSMDMALIELIQSGIREGNASVVLEARATNILKDDGAVSGLEITYADGTVKEFPFKAVIMGTGGYSHNQDMMPYANCGTCSPSTASGHGWELAENAGACMLPPSIYAPYAGGIPNAGFEMRYQANLKFPGAIWMGLEGARMANEDVPLLAKGAWGKASDNVGYVVFSDAQRVEGLRPIVLTSYLEGELTPWQSAELLDSLVDEGKVAWKADSAVELARAAGIDEAAFAQTIETYNGYCDAGNDADFGRTGLQKLEGALYALKTVPYQLQCTGGIRVNADANVLDASEQPIPGLYAGGEAIGMRQSSAGGQGGCGLGNAATWGYIAADSASAYVG